jgi:hypothetical protein
MKTHRTVLLLIILIVIMLAAVITHNVILKNSSYIKLGSTQSISGIVAQTLSTTKSSSLPVAGQDFNLTKIHYFDNNSWVVAFITPTKGSNIAGAMVVLEEKQGIYQVVLGPGTSFDNSVLISLPADVGKYINQQGYIYEYVYQ